MIQVIELSKKYGAKPVLKNINARFEAGKVCGIAGENGAGKTTFFKCLAGLEKYEGKVLSDPDPLKDHLGLLFTQPYFFSKMTGREYIRLLCNARQKPPKSIDEKNIFDLPLDQYASTYSTGMKKKLALTAILLQENKVFILDEPFNGVDIGSNIIIKEIIFKLRETGKTILISSHIFSVLSDVCDEIRLLKNGEFTAKAGKEDFAALEREMVTTDTGNKIERLGLK